MIPDRDLPTDGFHDTDWVKAVLDSRTVLEDYGWTANEVDALAAYLQKKTQTWIGADTWTLLKSPMTAELWQAFEVFLALEHTGRVTFHVERGVVRMVETTAIIRPTRTNNIDKKLADPVESS